MQCESNIHLSLITDRLLIDCGQNFIVSASVKKTRTPQRINYNSFNTARTKDGRRNTTRGGDMHVHIQNTLPQAQPAGATSSSL